MLGSKNLRSMTPPKFGFLIQNKVLEANKNFRGPQKMKKTVFLKNGPTNFFPTNKSDISEAHRDLLHWNLSWAFPFNILVYEEGSVPYTGSSYSSCDQRRTGLGQAGDDNVVLLPEVLLTDG